MTIARIPSAGTPSAQLPPRPTTAEPSAEDYVDTTPWTPRYCEAQLDDDPVFPTRCAERPGHLGAHRSSSMLGMLRVSWETPEGGAA
ncbi:hypothetical protein ACIRON_02850 [Nocardioides sp. NPDC101246]|uniref:hypothetical protein n=1 Tax=Nocardioides sp. NPDC101246 TaxID=3364336 RepID=UPI0038037A83